MDTRYLEVPHPQSYQILGLPFKYISGRQHIRILKPNTESKIMHYLKFWDSNSIATKRIVCMKLYQTSFEESIHSVIRTYSTLQVLVPEDTFSLAVEP